MITCIAIDDEPLALKQMESYISKTPFLELIGTFGSALEAITFLQQNPTELIFTDINMPDLNGMEFIKTFQSASKVIFTTAHSEYAIEGFKVDALDYLLKPISYGDFLKAAQKAQQRLRADKSVKEQISQRDEYLFIKAEYKMVRIKLADIKYIESMREYVRIHLVNEKPVMTLASMKTVVEALPADKFMRIHRSYIVNLTQITTIDRSRIVFEGNVYLPVSDQYSEAFKEYIDKHFLG